MIRPLIDDPIGTALYLVAAVPFAAIVLLASRTTAILGAIGVAAGACYLLWSRYVVRRRPSLSGVFGVRGFVAALIGCGLLAATRIRVGPLDAAYLAAFLLVAFYYWVVGAGALVSAGTERTRSTEDRPPVTVLVPAYDEEGYVGQTVRSVLDAGYDADRLEVVVVDDGSTDGTRAEAEAVAAENDAVRVVSKANGGKHSALNYGLLFASHDLIVTVDADTELDPGALYGLVDAFEGDPEVGAVAGTIRVRNRAGLLGGCQALEYVVGINLERRLFDALGVVTVVPGCFGAFRRGALDAVSGFDPDTMTEDFDATLQVLRAGYRVRAADAAALTEAPETWRDLYRQRLRWYRGNLLTLLKHADLLAKPGTSYLHRVAYPLWIAEMLFLPAVGFLVLGSIGWALVTGAAGVAATLGAFLALVVVAVALAVWLGDEDPRLLLFAPLLVVGYKTVVDALLLKSLFDVVAGRVVTWTRPGRVRQGSAAAEEESAAQ